MRVKLSMRACAMNDLSLSAEKWGILVLIPWVTRPFWQVCSYIVRRSYCNATLTTWIIDPFDLLSSCKKKILLRDEVIYEMNHTDNKLLH